MHLLQLNIKIECKYKLFLFYYFLPKFVVLPLKALILIVSFEEGASESENSSDVEASLTEGFGKRIKVIYIYIYTYISLNKRL